MVTETNTKETEMISNDDIKLFIKLLFIRKFVWPELPQSGSVKGRLAMSDDTAKNSSFFSSSNENNNLTKEDIIIPQYAIHKKSKFLKIPCIIIQAEGNGRAYLIGYKNLINGENGTGWVNEFKFLGKQRLPKKYW